jgi:aspartate/methionine/tyrosine aminotransferase
MKDLLASLCPVAAALPESGIVRVINYGRERSGLIPFWAGEGDLPTPDFISDAAIRALRDGHTFYTYQRGIPPLRDAVADYLQRHFAVAIGSHRVIITGSGMQAIQLTMQALIGPGDEILVVTPVWPNIYAAVQIQNALPVSVPLERKQGRWRLDLDRLFAACGPNTKALFLNTPNNPTGWVIGEDDMLKVRDFARDHDLWIVADEVYSRFVYDRQRARSFLEMMEPGEKLVVTNTFSKNWSMTGWRVGWAVIPAYEELAQIYENLVQYNTSGVPAFLQYGCLAALREGDAYVENLIERCRQGREIVCNRLSDLPRVSFIPPDGTFYLFFKVEGEEDSTAFALRMIDEANVGLAPGAAFGPGGEGFVRLCFAASHETLRSGVERLAAALT